MTTTVLHSVFKGTFSNNSHAGDMLLQRGVCAANTVELFVSIYVNINVNLCLPLLVRVSPDHRPQIKPVLHISLMRARLHYAGWDKSRHYRTLWASQQYSGGSFISDTSHLLFLLRRKKQGSYQSLNSSSIGNRWRVTVSQRPGWFH